MQLGVSLRFLPQRQDYLLRTHDCQQASRFVSKSLWMTCLELHTERTSHEARCEIWKWHHSCLYQKQAIKDLDPFRNHCCHIDRYKNFWTMNSLEQESETTCNGMMQFQLRILKQIGRDCPTIPNYYELQFKVQTMRNFQTVHQTTLKGLRKIAVQREDANFLEPLTGSTLINWLTTLTYWMRRRMLPLFRQMPNQTLSKKWTPSFKTCINQVILAGSPNTLILYPWVS